MINMYELCQRSLNKNLICNSKEASKYPKIYIRYSRFCIRKISFMKDIFFSFLFFENYTDFTQPNNEQK